MKSALRELALFAFFVIAAGFVLRPLPSGLTDSIPAGSDPPHHLYILSWLLDHGLSSDRFEGRMFHPAKNAVLRSDLSLGTVVLLAPIAPLIDEPLVRFNLATWLSLAFSGWAFFLASWKMNEASQQQDGIAAVYALKASLLIFVLVVGLQGLGLLAKSAAAAFAPPPEA